MASPPPCDPIAPASAFSLHRDRPIAVVFYLGAPPSRRESRTVGISLGLASIPFFFLFWLLYASLMLMLSLVFTMHDLMHRNVDAITGAEPPSCPRHRRRGSLDFLGKFVVALKYR